MKSKRMTKAQSSNGRRGQKSAAGAAPGAAAVFLIEDNRPLRDGLTAMLGVQGLNVVATARSGAEALRHVARLKPQVVLLDATLGGRDGLRLVEAVKKLSPKIKVIVHLPPGQEDVVALVRAGVSGFILKDASIAECVATIRSVADGKSVLPPNMTGALFSHVAGQVPTRTRRVKATLRLVT